MKRSLRGGQPPLRGPKKASKDEVAKPDLPRERPVLPGGVMRDIKRTARPAEVEDVATAVAVAGEALDQGDLDRGIELLTWARSRAPRSVPIREGLGVAHYLAGQFEDAQRELQAYRRMSGRADQNHLLADSARALGHTEKVLELVDEMTEAHQRKHLDIDRLLEGIIVHAGVRADEGDLAGAIRVLERAPLPDGVTEIHGRVWYAAGDFAERMGDASLAREYFEAVQTVDDEFLDVQDRLDALGS